MPDTDICAREISSVASSAPFADVAIETASGPHVTPVLFATGAGHLWFAVSRATLKARVLRARPGVGVALRGREGAVMLRGEVRLLDPLRPASLVHAPRAVAASPFGLQAFARRNPRELAGFGLDALQARGGPMASGLVIAAVEPTAIAVVDAPPAARHGQANGGHEGSVVVPEGTPDAAARLARRDGEVVVGWSTPDGPVAIPAFWDSDFGVALVAADAARFADIQGSSQACIAFEAADRRRPTGKRGLMLRGVGRVTAQGAGTAISIDADRASWWVGFKTGTSHATAVDQRTGGKVRSGGSSRVVTQVDGT